MTKIVFVTLVSVVLVLELRLFRDVFVSRDVRWIINFVFKRRRRRRRIDFIFIFEKSKAKKQKLFFFFSFWKWCQKQSYNSNQLLVMYSPFRMTVKNYLTLLYLCCVFFFLSFLANNKSKVVSSVVLFSSWSCAGIGIPGGKEYRKLRVQPRSYAAGSSASVLFFAIIFFSFLRHLMGTGNVTQSNDDVAAFI